MPPKYSNKRLNEEIQKTLADYVTFYAGIMGSQPDFINPAFKYAELVGSYHEESKHYVLQFGEDINYPVANKLFVTLDSKGVADLKKKYIKVLDSFEEEVDKAFDKIQKDSSDRYTEEEIEDAKKYVKDVYLKYFNIYKKGYSTNLLHARLSFSEGMTQLACVFPGTCDEMTLEALRAEKYGYKIPGKDGEPDKIIKPTPFREGFTSFVNILDTYTDYWKDRDGGKLTPVSLTNYRAKILEQLDHLLPLAHKLLQAKKGDPTSLIQNQFTKGMNPYEDMFESSPRGAFHTLYSLSAMHAGLKNGWSLEDLDLLANFNCAIKHKKMDALKGNQVNYQPGEEEFLERGEALMEKIASTPLTSAADRQKMLEELEALCREGKEKGYFLAAYNNVLEDELAISKELTDTMPLTGSADFDTALIKFNTSRAGIFKNETTEHENLRKAAEDVKRAYEKFMTAVQDGTKTQEELDEIQKEYADSIRTMKTQADIYISEKRDIPNTPAGKERLYGAAELKMVGDMLLRELERKEPFTYPKPGVKYEEKISEEDLQVLQAKVDANEQEFEAYYKPKKDARQALSNAATMKFFRKMEGMEPEPEPVNENEEIKPLEPKKEIEESPLSDAKSARESYFQKNADNEAWLGENLDEPGKTPAKIRRIAIAVTMKKFEDKDRIIFNHNEIGPEEFQSHLMKQQDFREMMNQYKTEDLLKLIESNKFEAKLIEFSDNLKKMNPSNGKGGNGLEEGEKHTLNQHGAGPAGPKFS